MCSSRPVDQYSVLLAGISDDPVVLRQRHTPRPVKRFAEALGAASGLEVEHEYEDLIESRNSRPK